MTVCDQAAEILLMMRPETEVPSDFQDYTLVTVVSVAAHLSGHELGDKACACCAAAPCPARSLRSVCCASVMRQDRSTLRSARDVSEAPRPICTLPQVASHSSYPQR